MYLVVKKRIVPVQLDCIAQYFLLYIMLLLHGAEIYALNGTVFSCISVFVCGVYILLHRYLYKNYYVVHMILIAVCMALLIVAHRQPYFGVVAVRILEPLMIMFVAYQVNKEKFFARFIRITLFFAIVSLGFYLVQIIQPDILRETLTRVEGWELDDFYGVLFYTYRGHYAEFRNNGIFTEPGLYQMILNAALGIMLFFPELCNMKRKNHILSVIVLIITVITTGSTTGYISLAIIVVGYMFNKSEKGFDKKIRRYILLICILAAVLLLVDYNVRDTESLLHVYVVNKFVDMGVVENASGSARMSVIKICSQLISQNPLSLVYGWGYDAISNVIEFSGSETAGAFIVYFLAAAGIPTTIVVLYPYLFKPYKEMGFRLESVIFLLLYFNTSLAQSRETYPTLLLLPFAIAQYKVLRKKRLEDNAKMESV